MEEEPEGVAERAEVAAAVADGVSDVETEVGGTGAVVTGGNDVTGSPPNNMSPEMALFEASLNADSLGGFIAKIAPSAYTIILEQNWLEYGNATLTCFAFTVLSVEEPE